MTRAFRGKEVGRKGESYTYETLGNEGRKGKERKKERKGERGENYKNTIKKRKISGKTSGEGIHSTLNRGKRWYCSGSYSFYAC